MPYKSQLHHAIILPFQANGWLSSTNRAVVRVVCAHLPWQGLRDERFSLVSLYLSSWRAPNLSLSSVCIYLMIAKRWISLLPEQNRKSIQNCWLLNSCTAAAVRLLYTSHSRSRYHLFFIPTHCSPKMSKESSNLLWLSDMVYVTNCFPLHDILNAYVHLQPERVPKRYFLVMDQNPLGGEQRTR